MEAASQDATVSLLGKALENSRCSLARTVAWWRTWKRRERIAVRLSSLLVYCFMLGWGWMWYAHTASGFGTTIMSAKSTISFCDTTPSPALIASIYVSSMSLCCGSCLACWTPTWAHGEGVNNTHTFIIKRYEDAVADNDPIVALFCPHTQIFLLKLRALLALMSVLSARSFRKFSTLLVLRQTALAMSRCTVLAPKQEMLAGWSRF